MLLRFGMAKGRCVWVRLRLLSYLLANSRRMLEILWRFINIWHKYEDFEEIHEEFTKIRRFQVEMQ